MDFVTGKNVRPNFLALTSKTSDMFKTEEAVVMCTPKEEEKPSVVNDSEEDTQVTIEALDDAYGKYDYSFNFENLIDGQIVNGNGRLLTA